MGDSISISIQEKGYTSRREFSNCVSMNFIKEIYTPYSYFRGTFVIAGPILEIIDVEVKINDILVYKGSVDFSEYKQLPSHRMFTISSRGYTSALGYNELKDGIHYNINLEELMNLGDVLPNVSIEKPTKNVSYLFVKKHSSMWDAAVNLCLKGENTYPYIGYPNLLRFTKHSNPKIISFSNVNNVIEITSGNDYSKAISHINMKDTAESYDQYFEKSDITIQRNIIRHKYIDLDKQWLSNPNQGLVYRLNYANRGAKFNSITYKGFNGEDLNDRYVISAWGYWCPNKYISKIEIFGSKNGLFTRLTAYDDSYCN